MASVMPTLLHDLQMPVPSYVDGPVIPVFKSVRAVHYEDRPLNSERHALRQVIDQLAL